MLVLRYLVISLTLILTFFLSYISYSYIQTDMIEVMGYPLILFLWLWIFIIQLIVFLPSFIYKTEHYYDITGGLTFISTILIAIYFKFSIFGIDFPSVLLSVLVIIWASRLSIFLFLRVKKIGEDIRFKKIKHSFSWFLMTFFLQGLWVYMCLYPAITIISSVNEESSFITVVGVILWIIGFSFEVTADNQKSNFNKLNKGKFISIGLWSLSRHPNYFGEFILWLGVSIISIDHFQNYIFVALISPLFVYFLLNKVSGINLLEDIAEKRWGSNKDFQIYKKKTPKFFPKIF